MVNWVWGGGGAIIMSTYSVNPAVWPALAPVSVLRHFAHIKHAIVILVDMVEECLKFVGR